MALKMSPPGRNSRLFTALPGLLAPFVTYVLAPLLIALSIAAGVFWMPSVFSSHQGHPMPTRYLASSAQPSPDTALLQLIERPTRLSQTIPAGPLWFLADLPSPPSGAQAYPQVLLLPLHTITNTACWLLQRANYPAGGSPYEFTSLQTSIGITGTFMQLPATYNAQQVICHTTLTIPNQISIERWDRTQLADQAIRAARSIGLMQGGLLTLALFLLVIAFTTHEWLFVLLSCWLVGNLRLGAWALGWDYQWLGFLIPPEALPWVRKFTLVLCYLVTYHLFTGLFRDSLTLSTQTQIRRVGNLSTALLLVAILGLPYQWFQTIVFLAAWLVTGLVAIILIHALFGSHTRAKLWHTVGVCIALSILLIGLILVGLQQRELIDPQLGTIALLLCNVIIGLAVAEQMRESRQIRSRERNDLIAHDGLTPLGIFTLGAARQFEHMNPSLRAMLRVDETEELPNWADFFPPMDWLNVSLATEQGQDLEILAHTTPDGTDEPRRFLLRATQAGSRIEGSLQDVSARSETIRNLRLMDDNDPLTNTLNRRGIETAMQASIDSLRETNTPAAMAFLDLDHLKRVNDLFGHNAGDTLLQMVCERVKYSLGKNQHLGRVGNDEFIILFPNMRAAEARQIGQDILESLNAAPLIIGERSFQLKTAMGIIDIDRKMDPKDAIAAASRACRDARQQHRDIVLYEEDAAELSDHFNEQQLFEQIEKNQLPQEALYLEMQPIMALRHPLKSLNFEVLLRVRNPGDRPVNTQNVIEAAEENGIITTLDKWVFTTMLDWMRAHHEALAHTQIINVNLSGVSLNDDRFIDTLFGLLSSHPQLTRSLCVEITEGVALQDLERTRQFMRRLQRMGARVALDDFGAGYTSFSYLKELPADMIKIDGSLIRDMLASDANVAIVNSIVDLAHNLGMECIAEWVEDAATLRKLADMGMDYVQGYSVSRSLPPDTILAHENILPLVTDPAVRHYITEVIGRQAPAPI
ncbi:MAG TPA: bifunctional diguanylate cyclase/phosphodiesterase [Castellaniella sp.]|uniref:putative bifunctional diguanylate cyclase/phosphodiesterase n=1 Tax=Castellaniella sp. TaxID=1955812 RepID=UPI002F1E7C1E